MPAMNAPASPAHPAPFVPQIRLYQQWLARERGLSFESYQDLWHWSVTELDAFWRAEISKWARVVKSAGVRPE